MEWKNSFNEIQNTFETFNSRLDQARRKKFRTRKQVFTKNVSGKNKEKKNIQSIHGKWDTIKQQNICIFSVPKTKEETKELENLFNKMLVEKFPNVARDLVTQTQESQRFPNRYNSKRSPQHIRVKLSKSKPKNS